jgi:hypothetical protein
MMPIRSLRPILLVCLLVGACIPSSVSTPAPSNRAAAASASGQASQPEPSVETGQPPSNQPAASDLATDSASPGSQAPGASASAGTGPAAACSGTDKNREFFQTAAAAVNWTVYCAVLPAGWFVDSGTYRGSGGGWLQIAYKGPGGARLELREGAFCSAADGCVPPGSDAGGAAFGDRTGTLVKLDSGGWAVVVDRGKPVSWLAVGTGLDQATFQQLAGALAIVGA